MLALEQKPIVEQLVEIYEKYENWHTKRLSYEQAYQYHNIMLGRNAIIIYQQEDMVLGYFEVWLINFEQFGRLVAHASFNQLDEDIISGNLAYVANTWIHPDFRQGAVYKILRNRFFLKCCKCDFFVGSALRKKTQPIKVFTRLQLHSKLFVEGKNG